MSLSVTTTLEETRGGPGGPVDDEPAFETRGIEYIPVSERRGTPTDLFWMWAGALFNVEYAVYGALLIVAFDLRFWQAAVVILVGNLSYLITGLGSLQGPRAGTAAFTINRAPYGPNGAKLIAVFNWMTQVGYEVVGLALVVAAGLAEQCTIQVAYAIGVADPMSLYVDTHGFLRAQAPYDEPVGPGYWYRGND